MNASAACAAPESPAEASTDSQSGLRPGSANLNANVSLQVATDAGLREQYLSVRGQSLQLVEPLTPEDMMVQSMPEASPAKWHIAHTSWFFETFILREFVPGYEAFHPDFLWLFNSYYNSVSDQPEKKLRASFSRPTLDAIVGYRQHVDSAIQTMLASGAEPEARRRLVLGLHHEQQHQELLITDVKHAFWSNPLRPAYREGALPGTEPGTSATRQLRAQRWRGFPGGLVEIGYREPESASSRGTDGFSFDNEQPRHRVYLEPFEIASRPVCCAEYLQFIEDGGYRRAELWLAAGWQAVQDEGWQAPLYWHRESAQGEWSIFTLRGEVPLNQLLAAPVCHISYYEADAFARWAGCRLPTEAEWETAAQEALAGMQEEGTSDGATHSAPSLPRAQQEPGANNNHADSPDLLEGGALHPVAAFSVSSRRDQLRQLFGGVWEWTGSAYLGYPGYKAVPGALGEYNGKFMSSQMVLRGGSVATPASHIRETYRNFFPPSTRWQFSGIRLARNQS